jgi:hypothetical protein
VPNAADIAALKALGVSRVIVGSSFSHDNGDGTYVYIAEDQMAAFEAAGFEVQEYQFIGRHYPSARPIWLDVELAETVDDIRAALRSYKIHGIYTRRGIWDLLDVDLLGEFPGLKLWDANYGPLPRTFIPYGGWTKADMTQYHDTMDIGTGFEVDLSVYDEMPEEDAMQIAPWWTDRKIPTKLPTVKYEINLFEDFGPAKAYDLRIVMAAGNKGAIVFKHGDFATAAICGSTIRAGSFMLIPGIYGTAPFDVLADVEIAYLACAGKII